MKKILSIAGSDNTGGAGIQADIKTILSHGMYPMTVVTVVTSQNDEGIYKIHKIPIDVIESQLDTIFIKMKPDAIKIGLIGNKNIAKCIFERINYYNIKNIVLDPILSLSVNSKKILLNHNDINFLINQFSNIVDIITPNINEAKFFLKEIYHDNIIDIILNLSKILKTNILLKGGHSYSNKNSDDYLYTYKNQNLVLIKGKKIITNNTHGTGCILSTAIACNLANGYDILNSIYLAKKYLSKMLKQKKFNFNLLYGPVPHIISKWNKIDT